MRARRHDVGEMHETFAAVGDEHRLMVASVTAGDDGAHSGDDVGFAVERLEHRAHRSENLGDVTIRGMQPLVARMVGYFELAALHEDSRARKRRFERARIAPPHDSAAM